jgi:hypothetical protein
MADDDALDAEKDEAERESVVVRPERDVGQRLQLLWRERLQIRGTPPTRAYTCGEISFEWLGMSAVT